MRIMQVIPCLKIGGAERMCEALSLTLKELGHEVVIVSLFNQRSVINQNLEDNGIKIEYLGKHVGIDISVYFKLHKLIKKYKPDAVHTHLNALKYTAGVASHLLHHPIVHTFHSLAEKEAPEFDRKTNKKIYLSEKAVPVALTDKVRDSVETLYKVKKDAIPVIYNGVDIRKFIQKSRYDFNNIIRIIHVASFTQPKNHECLIEAFAKIHKKYPNTVLSLAGVGDKLEQIKTLADELNISESVEFLGSVSNVSDALCKSDIFILPSVYEGMPMSIIEAMASGLPVVASRVGGIPDMIDDGEDGILIEPTVDGICAALETLINDEDLRERIGKNAKIKSEKFSSFVMAENYLELYRKAKRN